MRYEKPNLEVVGRALQVVLGGVELQEEDRGNGSPVLTRTSDGITQAHDQAVW